MKKVLAGAVIATALATAPMAPAKASEITTETLAYTFVLALAGTAAGAMIMPYAVPVAGPVIAGAYTATANTVSAAVTGLGTLIVTEPRMTGALLGMGAGLASGLYFYSE